MSANFFRKLRKILGPTPTPEAVQGPQSWPGEKGKPGPPGVSQRGIDCIKHFESCLEPVTVKGVQMFAAYPDPAHGWKAPTIGWGTIQYPDGRKVAKGDLIDQARADELLAWEVSEKAEGVAKLVTVPLNSDQFAALVSFAYNVGLGNLGDSTLLKWLNAGSYNNAADQFLKWNRAGGKVLAGLTRRRKSERNLFLGKADFIER